MSESFDKAVEEASLVILTRATLRVTTIRAALRAALPHLTAEDVPHLIRQAKAEAWEECSDEFCKQGIVQVPPNPYDEEADHE